jgi:CRISPR-associated protein Csd1
MMLKELYSIGLTMRDSPDWPVEMYEDRKVRWEVWLTEHGKLRPGGVKIFDQRNDPVIVAAPDRPNNKVPCLIVDNPEYVLGVGENGAKNHPEYMAVLEKCAKETGNRSVAVLHAYLQGHLDELLSELRENGFDDSGDRGDGRKPAEWINFRVGDVYPIDSADVRAWWAHYARDELDRSEICCISGARARITRKFPVTIRLNGKGCKLASVDSPACKSYGFDKTDHAPMSHDAALVAGTALKLIISDRESCKQFGDVYFAFWTRQTAIRRGLAALVSARGEDEARISQVKAFFESIFTGREHYPPEDRFYMFVATNTETRIVIRAALEASLGTILSNVREWFRSIELVGPGGVILTVQALHDSVQVSNRRQNRAIGLALVERAFFGTLLEGPIYASALGRTHSSIHARDRRGNKSRPEWRCPSKKQVSIIKLYLSQSKPEVKELVALKEDFPDIAYQYGRLMAAYEAIQLDASPDVQTTVTERFFSAMMLNPKRAVAKLDLLSKHHLRKVARDHGKGWEVNHSKRLQEINHQISAQGTAECEKFSLDQRGLFVLGYWHEKFRTYNPDKKGKGDEQ